MFIDRREPEGPHKLQDFFQIKKMEEIRYGNKEDKKAKREFADI